ncbi:unknown [Sea turtle tornovirus 1]|uniref:hypothetical protein n=1 Tax=Sea turtle tornovirus 1 TaxID=575913 RepID=UPI0001931186|nr:unknown [Sea turtle tornovirus 1]ACJ54447.1 unknown [Sea turtle tornovirus 1]ACJ54451.1 unknown [Sea turtle tornovirus 1]ACJ54455.1 unknown [Sea turtle tornovirus 1]ACJ54473.1 unknown [Sea turtle tornovirus 1]ACJ54475.1 unknown [Sea turtle tornovirus 1]
MAQNAGEDNPDTTNPGEGTSQSFGGGNHSGATNYLDLIKLQGEYSFYKRHYNRALAIWKRECRESHDRICTCKDWRYHFSRAAERPGIEALQHSSQQSSRDLYSDPGADFYQQVQSLPQRYKPERTLQNLEREYTRVLARYKKLRKKQRQEKARARVQFTQKPGKRPKIKKEKRWPIDDDSTEGDTTGEEDTDGTDGDITGDDDTGGPTGDGGSFLDPSSVRAASRFL